MEKYYDEVGLKNERFRCPKCGNSLSVLKVATNKYWGFGIFFNVAYCDNCKYESEVGSSDCGEVLSIWENYINNEKGEYETVNDEVIVIE